MIEKVIYTDLDGSLLDHDTYSHEPVDGLLAELEKEGIPVVPCTSKTRAELLPLREEIGNRHPFIFENGAAVAIPHGYFDEQPEKTCSKGDFWIRSFTLPREHWLSLIQRVAAEYTNEYRGFSDMHEEEVARLTGLTHEQAGRALQREYGEPILWMGGPDRLRSFIDQLQQAGAVVLRGGRFLHVSGRVDKGQALRWLNSRYEMAVGGHRILSIAAGDSQNDLAMLEAADQAVVIQSPAHPVPLPERSQDTYYTASYGPQGWVEGILHFLKI